jgi:hypothetical protein
MTAHSVQFRAGSAPANQSSPPANHRIANPWQVLNEASDGRLLFLTGHGVRAVVVQYTLAGEEIMLHLPDFNEAAHYVSNSHVVLEAIAPVDGFRWKVLASGDAAKIPDHDVLAATAAHLEQWPTGIASRYIVIKPISLDVEPDEP